MAQMPVAGTGGKHGTHYRKLLKTICVCFVSCFDIFGSCSSFEAFFLVFVFLQQHPKFRRKVEQAKI